MSPPADVGSATQSNSWMTKMRIELVALRGPPGRPSRASCSCRSPPTAGVVATVLSFNLPMLGQIPFTLDTWPSVQG